MATTEEASNNTSPLLNTGASHSKVKDTSHLAPQDLATLDISVLNPLSPQVISRQATINIGTIGHVAHGKSTVVKAISGVQTVRFKNELERNITIKLGYANAKIFKCDNPECPRPTCYRSYGSAKEDKPQCERVGCGSKMTLMRHVSFVDCFGLDTRFAKADGTFVVNSDLQVGDKLLGPDGKERVVLSIKDGKKEMYEIKYQTTQKIGAEPESFTVTGGHLLCLRIDTPVDRPVIDRNNGGKYFVKKIIGDENGIRSTKFYFATKALADKYYRLCETTPQTFEITVDAYLNAPKTFRTKARLYRAPIMEFAERDLINLSLNEASQEEVAWLIGLWFGNGDQNNPAFVLHSTNDQEVVDRIKIIAAKIGLGVVITPYADKNAICVSLSTQSGFILSNGLRSNENAQNPFYLLLSKLGVIHNKHIPSTLYFHTISVRQAIVAGFIDSDGVYSHGQFDLEQSERIHTELFFGFVWLLRSLGFVAHVSLRSVVVEEVGHKKWRVHFNGPKASELPIANRRKRGHDLIRLWATSQQFSVTPIGVSNYRGFEVDGDGRVLLDNFIVVHNCPGHDILMATMLNGAAVMDAALLLIAGNEFCPQPQTSEHLAAIEIMKLKHILILQNKIDLVKENAAVEQHHQILKFVEGTVAEGAPIVPISAQMKYNIDVICEYIIKKIPIPVRDFTSSPRLIVIRSFDVNKPGAEVDDLKGGVAGGSIIKGVLKLGDEIEVRPGIVTKDAEGNIRCTPIFSRIVSLFAEENDLKYAVPGGLIGVGTKIDPTLCRADRLVGQVLGEVGKLPSIFTELEINFFLLRRLLGVKAEGDKQSKVQKLGKGEVLMVNIGSTSTGGRIIAVKQDLAKIVLISPVCTQEGEKIALSRRVDKHWRLIGWGQIMRGSTIPINSQ